MYVYSHITLLILHGTSYKWNFELTNQMYNYILLWCIPIISQLNTWPYITSFMTISCALLFSFDSSLNNSLEKVEVLDVSALLNAVDKVLNLLLCHFYYRGGCCLGRSQSGCLPRQAVERGSNLWSRSHSLAFHSTVNYVNIWKRSSSKVSKTCTGIQLCVPLNFIILLYCVFEARLLDTRVTEKARGSGRLEKWEGEEEEGHGERKVDGERERQGGRERREGGRERKRRREVGREREGRRMGEEGEGEWGRGRGRRREREGRKEDKR